MLYGVRDNVHIFVCREYTGTHLLQPGPVKVWASHKYQHRELPQVSRPKDAKIEILAVV